MKRRWVEFDILRSFAVIWIIAIWHFSNYFSPNSCFGNIVNESSCITMTKVMLSLFMFLSGLFTNTVFSNGKDIKSYYIKKAKRFYPLYAVATFTLYFTTIPETIVFYDSPLQLILSLFGLATLFHQAPSTLWFMDMLLFLILITPFLMWKSNKWIKAIKMILLCCIAYILCMRLGCMDSRYVLYMPFYMMGLYITPNEFLNISTKFGVLSIAFAIFLLLLGKHHFVLDIIANLFLIIFGGAIASLLCRFVVGTKFRHVVKLISYSSMCAYFFHRQLYALGIISHLPIYFIPILVFVISYYIQVIYDRAVK